MSDALGMYDAAIASCHVVLMDHVCVASASISMVLTTLALNRLNAFFVVLEIYLCVCVCVCACDRLVVCF